jgi:hypothetical protein
MSANRDLERRLSDFYSREPLLRASDWVLESALSTIESRRQRRGLLAPWRFARMTTSMKMAAAAAAVVAVGAIAIWQLAPAPAGPGGPTSAPTGTPVPTPAPTPSPTLAPASTPAAIPEDGAMAAGTYFTHPLAAPDDALTLTLTVPDGWHGFGAGSIFPDGAPGIAFQFLDVTSINDDLCQWKSPDGDVDAGTTVDDLVAALTAQTAYEVSDPVDVSIGGHSGKRVDVVYPAELFDGTGSSAPDCDEGVARLYTTRRGGEGTIYGQGPDERWQANILDVDGTRLIIIAQDFPDTSAADLAAGQAIIDSMVIEP